jgi:hypothetical protein
MAHTPEEQQRINKAKAVLRLAIITAAADDTVKAAFYDEYLLMDGLQMAVTQALKEISQQNNTTQTGRGNATSQTASA